MGLLTDPSSEPGKLTKLLVKYYNPLCVLLYVAGLLWFAALAHPSLNSSTYFSENALLPGLVKSEFAGDNKASLYHEELLDEMKKLHYQNSIPHPWILAKFQQIGLDTYSHNFSVRFPLRNSETYSGTNVYGILRAARASSTEALILSVPYRPKLSAHPTTAPSIAIMLAFAQYANVKKYWAKDIIFLITEHEQVGVQAWLEAYHGVSCGDGTLLHGDLRGRGGAIQAAINLELHDIQIGKIDIKVEGLNGQLPNLDLFNLAVKMCIKEGISNTFKNYSADYGLYPFENWYHSFQALLAMVSTQATGIPNGNHGLFHRFGIQALTIEGFSGNIRDSSTVGFKSIGRLLEGVFRSLNNLLERFHQSFFFYLLPSSEKYISIGLYMPAVCLMAGVLFIKACAKWCYLEEKNRKSSKENSRIHVKYENIFLCCLSSHIIGMVIMICPAQLIGFGDDYHFSTGQSIFYGFILISFILLTFPIFFVTFTSCENSITILHIFSLLELGTALICISMNNFSLGLFCSTIIVPPVLLIEEKKSKCMSFVQKFVWLCIHPLIVLIVVVLINTFVAFSGENLKDNMFRGIDATQQAVVYSIVDSMIYGNWLFSVVSSIFIPIWLCFWSVTFSNLRTIIVSHDKKN